MNRYIETDALNKAFSKLRFNNNGELKHYGDRSNWILWGSEVETLIAESPSIDIIRCKECRYWSGCKSTMHNNHRCNRMAEEHNLDYWTRADDFCSYGEREDE